ncbi:MAG: glucosaminidase domain-containing protein [Saprospiraceae bacterium]
MKTSQSKGFQDSGSNLQPLMVFRDRHQMEWSVNQSRELSADIDEEGSFLLNLWNGMVQLFVALRYLFVHVIWRPMDSLPLPVFKVGMLSLVAIIFFWGHFGGNESNKENQVLIGGEQKENSEESNDALFAASFPSPMKDKKERLSDGTSGPFANLASDNIDDKKAKAYIRRFSKVAISEMHKFGIPASIKMAQGLLESAKGESPLSTNNNNHFGIKCFLKDCKAGHCSNYGDDSHKDFFRKYKSAWESWRAHSEMIAGGRYASLLENKNDYKAWAKGLKSLGYATDKEYAQKLIQTIEKYHLDLLDEA